MQKRPRNPRQLQLGFLPPSVPGAPDWGAFGAQRRAAAMAVLARLIRRAAQPDQQRGEDPRND